MHKVGWPEAIVQREPMSKSERNREVGGESEPEAGNRREFLRAAGRWWALGGLVALGAAASMNSRDAREAGCRRPTNPCETCGWLKGCGLPRAAATRIRNRAL
jgi:hypothetical protein